MESVMTITAVIDAILRHDYASWSRTDIERLTAVRWRAEDNHAQLVAAAGDWHLTARLRQPFDDDSHAEITDVRLSWPADPAGANDAYRRLLADTINTLGPPALVGGLGAVARWRSPQTLTTVTRIAHPARG